MRRDRSAAYMPGRKPSGGRAGPGGRDDPVTEVGDVSVDPAWVVAVRLGSLWAPPVSECLLI